MATYLHPNPYGGTYDPGAKLQTAQFGQVPNVNLDQLAGQPVVVPFAVEYTQTDLVAGSEHVSLSETLTISAG